MILALWKWCVPPPICRPSLLFFSFFLISCLNSHWPEGNTYYIRKFDFSPPLNFFSLLSALPHKKRERKFSFFALLWFSLLLLLLLLRSHFLIFPSFFLFLVPLNDFFAFLNDNDDDIIAVFVCVLHIFESACSLLLLACLMPGSLASSLFLA